MEKGLVLIENNKLPVLLAISDLEQSRGLMRVQPPVPNMAFVYDGPKVSKFWMANTPAPLDIVFCHKGVVTQICKGDPYSTKLIGDDVLSDLVLEFPLGTVASLNIKLGSRVTLFSPTKEELINIFSKKYHKIVKL